MGRKADVDRIVNAVETAEKLTSAEFVVALEPRSGSYRDIDLIFAASLNFVVMLFAFFGPIVVSPDWVPLNLIILFALAWSFSAYTPFIRRLFCSSQRMERQVRELAQLQFLNQGVTQTRGRTGVMVLVSQLEKRVAVVADSGVTRSVDDEKWKELMGKFKVDLMEATSPRRRFRRLRNWVNFWQNHCRLLKTISTSCQMSPVCTDDRFTF